MSDKVFVDTNILVYAHNLDAGKKHSQAASVLARIREDGKGIRIDNPFAHR